MDIKIRGSSYRHFLSELRLRHGSAVVLGTCLKRSRLPPTTRKLDLSLWPESVRSTLDFRMLENFEIPSRTDALPSSPPLREYKRSTDSDRFIEKVNKARGMAIQQKKTMESFTLEGILGVHLPRLDDLRAANESHARVLQTASHFERDRLIAVVVEREAATLLSPIEVIVEAHVVDVVVIDVQAQVQVEVRRVLLAGLQIEEKINK